MLRQLRQFIAGFRRPRIATGTFVTQLFERHGAGLADQLALIQEHNVSSRAKLGLDGGSTGVADCGFLHLLVKAFARKHVFEIGTYVGTSAVAQAHAARGHGGRVTTCDPEAYHCIPAAEQDVIHFRNMPADAALEGIKKQGDTVDMVFADWLPSRRTIELLNEVGTRDMIFAAHDYNPPDDKGVLAVELVSRYYRRAHAGQWFLPEPQRIRVAPGIELQQSVAVLVPYCLLDRLQAECCVARAS